MRISKITKVIINGVENFRKKHVVIKDVDFQTEDKYQKEALYKQLSELLNL